MNSHSLNNASVLLSTRRRRNRRNSLVKLAGQVNLLNKLSNGQQHNQSEYSISVIDCHSYLE
ncbi:hypothetical protein [Agarivorans gilvus]|uniref:Uncharacterized protein n=1 Tax=Agarivorans gilvus TaxID=680279 RepID=A0ABQ1I7T1_9ALTE|nr:hypothetical protein [Agarivorans gilvus]GGB17304.1 hypothetical protein GCM10007414_33390 [Agarivorans gilvus]